MQNNMAFIVNEMSQLVLYGAGVRGISFYKYFKRMNYNVQLIIDKEPDNVDKEFECPVVGLCDVEWSKLHDMVIIICMQNGLVHDRLANDLYNNGIKQIIFLPTKKKYLCDDVMMHCYRKIVEEDWNKSILVPTYDEMIVNNDEEYIISVEETMITCWATMEYIFSFWPDKKKENFFYNHISCLEPYLTLFKYFMGNDEFPYEYLRLSRGEDAEAQEKLLMDRVELWNTYEEKINLDPTYFSSAAIYASWDDEKKHFKVLDGHHRAVYLFLKDWYYIPIRISKEDYIKYINYRRMQSWDYLKRDSCVALFKICVSLLKWMNEDEVVFDKIYEQENTKGYVQWWIENNGLITNRECEGDKTEKVLFVCLEGELPEFINSIKCSWIITTQSCGIKYNLQKCKGLYSGFWAGKHEMISIYRKEE